MAFLSAKAGNLTCGQALDATVHQGGSDIFQLGWFYNRCDELHRATPFN
jgi:hypothetical protein